MSGGEALTGYEELDTAPQQVVDTPESSEGLLSAAESELIARARRDLQNPDALAVAEEQHSDLVNLRAGIEGENAEIRSAHEAFREEVLYLDYMEENFSIIDVPGGNTEAGLSNMFAYLGRLPDNQRAEMYSILTDEHALYDLEDYFMENGFVNSETYPNFQLFTQNTLNIELTQEQDIIETEVREAETEVREVETEVREEEELVFMRNKETFTDMHTVGGINARLLEITQPYVNADSSREVSEQQKQDIINYFTNLAQEPQEFAQVLDSLGGPESNLYERVSGFVLSEAPGLRENFDRYEREHRGEYVSPLPPILPDVAREVTAEMNENVDGADIEETIDFSTVPPSRSISLEGSEYELDANLPVGDFYPATVEYTEVTQEVVPQLNSISAVIEYIGELSEDANITEVKETITQMMPYTVKEQLGLVNLNAYPTIESLQKGLIGVLGTKKEELEKKLKEARERYESRIQELREEYKATIRERQENQKEILEFLRESGFDIIPQGFTDRIIEQINMIKNVDLGNGMSITSNIDIANGHLGFENSAETKKFVLGTSEKEGFIRLINLIVTGETDGENALVSEPASFVSLGQIVDPRTMTNRLNEGSRAIIGSGGGLDMTQVYNNLGWHTDGR